MKLYEKKYPLLILYESPAMRLDFDGLCAKATTHETVVSNVKCQRVESLTADKQAHSLL